MGADERRKGFVTVSSHHELIPADPQCTLLDALLDAGIDIDHACGGMGSCGTCRVFVRKGLELLGSRGDVEAERAELLGYDDNERLACQNMALPGLEIEIP